MSNQSIGLLGEKYALQYLKNKGLTILNHHYTTHWGELDIIAKSNDTVYFIEVKTRVGEIKGKPYEAIDYFKLKSLKRAIQQFLYTHSHKDSKHSLDIISIVLNSNYSVKKFRYYENAYSF